MDNAFAIKQPWLSLGLGLSVLAGLGAHRMWHDSSNKLCLAGLDDCWHMIDLHFVLLTGAVLAFAHLLLIKANKCHLETLPPADAPHYLLLLYAVTFGLLSMYWFFIRSESDNAKAWLKDPTNYWVMLYAWMIVAPTIAGVYDSPNTTTFPPLNSIGVKGLFVLLLHMFVDPTSELWWLKESAKGDTAAVVIVIVSIALFGLMCWFWNKNQAALGGAWAVVDLSIGAVLCAQLGWMIDARYKSSDDDITLPFDLLSTVKLSVVSLVSIYFWWWNKKGYQQLSGTPWKNEENSRVVVVQLNSCPDSKK